MSHPDAHITQPTFWTEAVDAYLASEVSSSEEAFLLQPFRAANPHTITVAIDPASAERNKRQLAGFLLFAVRRALEDHELTDGELQDLRQVCRILRIAEGDLRKYHPEEVATVLACEIERLLEDDLIDPAEALHKVKLQELLGLSYDEFVELTAPQIERVLVRVLRRIDSTLGPADLASNYRWFRSIVAFLDTVYNVNPLGSRDQRSGYIYVLVNAAMPGIVKIGKTTRHPTERMLELSGATGVPVPFELLFEVQVLDAGAAERYVHEKLERMGTRVADNREFFRLSPSVAVDLMLEARDSIGSFGVEIEPTSDGV